MNTIEFAEGLEKIGLFAFYQTDIESIVLPGSLRTISQGTFANCRRLKTVKFADGLEVLGTDEYENDNQWFYGVFGESALEHVELPSTLKRIEYNAFQHCKDLKSINLPRKLECLGKWCF